MSDIIEKETKLIAVYARVSTSAQEEQETIEAQLLQVRQFADKHAYTIVNEYLDNGWSGDSIIRPALDQLRIDAKKKIWEGVLIYDPDRLARRYSYQELVMDELREAGIEVIFVTTSAPKNEEDKILYGVKGLFAQYERAKIAERFRIGKINRVNLGHVLTTEAPFGYTYIPNMGKRGTSEYVFGYYKINRNEAKVVGMIFKWVANDGLTLRAVVRKLQEQSIPPRRSKRGVWNTSTLSTLLRNQTYIGKAHWGSSYAVVPAKPLKDEKYRKIKKSSKRMKPESEWLSIPVKAIVKQDLFDRAGQRLRENFAMMGRNKKNDYLLAGKIWCACGRRRAGEGPQHGKHLYYRCTDRVYSFPLPRTCNEGGINARIADEAVWQKLKQIMSTPALMLSQVERWMGNHKSNESKRVVMDIENAEKQIAKLNGQMDKYAKAYSADVFTLKQLKGYLAPLKEKMAVLEKSLAQAYSEQLPKLEMATPTIEEIELFAKDATKALDGLRFSSKKAIIGKTIDKIISTQRDLQFYGFINLQQIHVEFITESRYCRFAQRGEVHPVQSADAQSGGYQQLSFLYHRTQRGDCGSVRFSPVAISRAFSK